MNIKLSIVVLVKNEAKHLPRFFEKIKDFKNYEVIVNDNGSIDTSKAICLENNATVIEKEWLGDQAKQFNWVLENVKLKADWILRLDADEYLLPETIVEINRLLENTSNIKFNAFYLKRRHYVNGEWVKQGMYPTLIVRLFKNGFAKYSDTMLMDEHLIVNGDTGALQNDFVDDSLMTRLEWLDKHAGYAIREAKMSFKNVHCTKEKKLYYKFPIFIRPFIYFIYIYLFKGGFLNGKNGFYWFLFQVFFYRIIVDVYILAIKQSKK